MAHLFYAGDSTVIHPWDPVITHSAAVLGVISAPLDTCSGGTLKECDFSFITWSLLLMGELFFIHAIDWLFVEQTGQGIQYSSQSLILTCRPEEMPTVWEGSEWSSSSCWMFRSLEVCHSRIPRDDSDLVCRERDGPGPEFDSLRVAYWLVSSLICLFLMYLPLEKAALGSNTCSAA